MNCVDVGFSSLYLIEILHQTTTAVTTDISCNSCILSKFYIKPQRMASESYPQTCCILSKFYIKPQRIRGVIAASCGCILSKFYIKPQPGNEGLWLFIVVSYRNSTSNHNDAPALGPFASVVSYRNSTSNHNSNVLSALGRQVVSYRNSTSNHNSVLKLKSLILLYLIEILHQTTT